MALSAASTVIMAALALGHRPDPVLAAVAFLTVMCTYTYDRLPRGPERVREGRSGWMARHRRVMTWLSGCSLLTVLALVAVRPTGAWALVQVAMLWPYGKVWIPWRGNRVALRQLPGVKAPYVVVSFFFVSFLPQAVALDALGSPLLWWLAAAAGLLAGAEHVLNDLRDVDADRADGTASIPVLIGPGRARLLAIAIACVGGVVGLQILPAPFLLWTLLGVALIAFYRPHLDNRLRLWIEIQAVPAALVALAIGW
jgi:4-hydroxybenzoate polyprenyltransferase